MFGWRLGTKMTVVRLRDGGLWVHSPIPLDDEIEAELRELGPVRHVVAPNLFHHLHVGPMAATFEGSAVHAPGGLRRKRKDLKIDADLQGGADGPWGDELSSHEIGGTWLGEFVFHHAPSRLLITSDLLQNFHGTCDHWWTRWYLKVGGIYDRPGLDRLIRLMFRDRDRARADIDTVLGLDFDGVVLAHGDRIDEGGRDILAESYLWL